MVPRHEGVGMSRYSGWSRRSHAGPAHTGPRAGTIQSQNPYVSMFFKGLGPGSPWKRSAARFCPFSTYRQPIPSDSDLFRTTVLYFFIVGDTFSRIFQKMEPKIPTCRSRGIASWRLSGAFASVPPRRVSIDEPIFSSFAPRNILFINRDV